MTIVFAVNTVNYTMKSSVIMYKYLGSLFNFIAKRYPSSIVADFYSNADIISRDQHIQSPPGNIFSRSIICFSFLQNRTFNTLPTNIDIKTYLPYNAE